MSWIGFTDKTRNLFNPAGLGATASDTNAHTLATHEILPMGTLLIEATFHATQDIPQRLLSYDRFKEWRRQLAVTLTSSGTLTVDFAQGASTVTAEMAFPAPERETTIRVYYSWNAPKRWAQLAIELVDEGRFCVADAPAPMPMPMLDVLTIMRNAASTQIDPATRFVGVSDEIEPVGFSAGICAGTPVETPSGSVPIERLRRGDHVITATHGAQPVRWIAKRSAPALGDFQPVRLRAPFFGLTQDILVAPHHRIQVTGSEAEDILGQTDVLLEAKRLLGSHAAVSDKYEKVATYYHVLLDHHDCLQHGQIWSESLYAGQIARTPALLAASSLADMPPSAVPTHREITHYRLNDVEARSLAAVLHR